MALARVAPNRFFSKTSTLVGLVLLALLPGPLRSNMRTEREYRSLASMLLRLATDPPRVSEDWAERFPQVGPEGEEHRDVVGKIVDCGEMFFLADESSPHAYVLTNIRRVKALLGRKVRITGALRSPHVLAVEAVDELN